MQLGKVTRALDDIHGVLRAVRPTDRLTAVHACIYAFVNRCAQRPVNRTIKCCSKPRNKLQLECDGRIREKLLKQRKGFAYIKSESK